MFLEVYFPDPLQHRTVGKERLCLFLLIDRDNIVTDFSNVIFIGTPGKECMCIVLSTSYIHMIDNIHTIIFSIYEEWHAGKIQNTN